MQKKSIVLLSLLSVYLFWGGTFFGMKVAIETIPPFLMAGARFSIAGIILFLMARWMGAPRPNLLEWRETGIVGALLLLGGNGFVALSEQRVDSGIASLIVATIPLWVILFNWIGGQKKKPTRGVTLGIFLGFLGIAILVWQPGESTSSNGLDILGMGTLLFAAMSWSFGSLYSVQAKFPESRLMTTAMQMLVGGALLISLSYVMGDWSEFQLSNITVRSYVAMGYLILFGSIVSYNAYIWLLRNVDPSWVSTYAFVNPVVALFLGTMWGGENLSLQSMIGALIIVIAVAIITLYRERKGGSPMSISKYAFLMNSQTLNPEICSGELTTGEFHATIVAVNSMDMAKEEASRFEQAGYQELDLCGDFDEAAAKEIQELVGDALSVSFMTYLPEETDKLGALASMENYGILLLHPSFDSAKDRLVLKSEEFNTYVAGVCSLEDAVAVANQMIAEGIHFIELNREFDASMANQLIHHIRGAVPVGFAGRA